MIINITRQKKVGNVKDNSFTRNFVPAGQPLQVIKKGMVIIMKDVWFFFQDQILGMKWINELVGRGLSALGIDIEAKVGSSIQFFIYDVRRQIEGGG